MVWASLHLYTEPRLMSSTEVKTVTYRKKEKKKKNPEGAVRSGSTLFVCYSVSISSRAALLSPLQLGMDLHLRLYGDS